MYKIIYKIFLLAIAVVVISCSDDDEVNYEYTALVDVTGSSLEPDKYAVSLLFSTDGETFVDYPKLKEGQEYWTKVVDADGHDVTSDACYEIDWSSSSPKPKSVEGGIASFKLGSNNKVIAKVTNVPFVAADVAGSYTVVTDDWADVAEGSTLTVQAIDANHIRVVGYPATSVNHADLVITVADPSLGGVAAVESQASGAYGPAANQQVITTSGTGTIDCHGAIHLTLRFVMTGPAGTYAGNVLELQKQ